MKSYTTRSEMIGYATSLLAEDRREIRRAAENSSATGATFLSHSSKDEDLVDGAIRILRNHVAKVYIDKVDPAMPPYTTKKTASLLKDRISQTKRFVLLATKNSVNSNWVPWELGIADGKKGLSNIAIFPAVEERHQTTWTKSEYLGLYRRIIWGDIEGYDKPMWIVLDEEENTASPLRRWIQS